MPEPLHTAANATAILQSGKLAFEEIVYTLVMPFLFFYAKVSVVC